MFEELEAYVTKIFPGLAGVRFSHRWGGPVSAPVDLTPAIGFVGDERVVSTLGCIGHGVALTQLNGRTIADLLLKRECELTRVFFVNRRDRPLAAGAAALRARPRHPELQASRGLLVRAQNTGGAVRVDRPKEAVRP